MPFLLYPRRLSLHEKAIPTSEAAKDFNKREENQIQISTTMKATDHFKQAIKAYLDERAKTDELFAVSYAKESKNLDDCVTFILNQVKKSKCCGLTDDEVYSLAVHYYDEDYIEVGKLANCAVVVNHMVELTEEEKAQARQDAIKAYQDEQLRKMQQRTSKPKTSKVQQEIITPSLFDF